MILTFKAFLKRLILVLTMIFFTQIIYSQSLLIGSGYVNNYNSKFIYPNTLNGFNFDLTYHFNKRIGITSSVILYKNIESNSYIYKNWYLDLNSKTNFVCKANFEAYGIIGAGFQNKFYKVINPAHYNYNDNYFNTNSINKYYFLFNFGIGSQYRIYNSIWIKLNIMSNNDMDFIINTGLIYRFDFKK